MIANMMAYNKGINSGFNIYNTKMIAISEKKPKELLSFKVLVFIGEAGCL